MSLPIPPNSLCMAFPFMNIISRSDESAENVCLFDISFLVVHIPVSLSTYRAGRYYAVLCRRAPAS